MVRAFAATLTRVQNSPRLRTGVRDANLSVDTKFRATGLYRPDGNFTLTRRPCLPVDTHARLIGPRNPFAPSSGGFVRAAAPRVEGEAVLTRVRGSGPRSVMSGRGDGATKKLGRTGYRRPRPTLGGVRSAARLVAAKAKPVSHRPVIQRSSFRSIRRQRGRSKLISPCHRSTWIVSAPRRQFKRAIPNNARNLARRVPPTRVPGGVAVSRPRPSGAAASFLQYQWNARN